MARAPKLKMPERTRDAKPGTGIRVETLCAELDKIAEAGGPKLRTHVLTYLKEQLAGAKAHARERFEKGRLDGLETARVLAAIHDQIIIALWEHATSHVVVAENPTPSERLSLCAVGGYGRGEMAPESDVDLLFLIADKSGSAHTESLTEYMLYMLWDLGLKVGHATRTVDQCVKLAKEDQTILTSLLDLRYLSGDRDLADSLYRTYRRTITRGKGRAYIAEKLAERDARHDREGNSRYVIEPNIKEGKGGLRDLHVLYWIMRFLDQAAREDRPVADPQGAKAYVAAGLLDARAAKRFARAADFLWRTRHHLHWVAGRATETLSFDQQVKLARLMGHASGPVEEAVERFMREYFTNAREVGALTRIACAKLEAEKALRLPAGLYAFMPTQRRNLKNTDLKFDRGRLNFTDPLQIREKPSLILQIFETAGRRNVDIHPDAFSAIDFRRNLIDQDFRRDPQNSKIFQKILLGAKAPYATLKTMNEAKVLGRYLSEFGGIVARTQFNMHHAYTVDEHTLRLVDHFDDLMHGRLAEDIPAASEIAKGFDETQKLTLMLTCLLHDTGKGKGDQSVEGAQLARRACRRLNVSKQVTDDVAWLVRRHLDMSETAQRRDISDPDTIAEFAALVGSPARLQMLYVLTVADIRSVGPGVWNDWKAVLLRNLYHATLGYLDGREELAPAARAASLEEQLLERLPGTMGGDVAPIVAQLPQSYWLNFNMTDFVRHARFFNSVVDSGLSTARESITQTRVDKTRNVTELWVLTQDRPSLFADLTLAICAAGAVVAGARLNTGAGGLVFNVFYLHSSDGDAYGAQAEHQLDAIRRMSHRAAVGDVEALNVPAPIRSRRAGAIPVRARTRFIDTSTEDLTILEIQGRDRPGILHAIAGILQRMGLDVQSAHIEVVGATAIDTFYIRGDLPAKRRKSLKAELLDLLRDASVKKAA